MLTAQLENEAERTATERVSALLCSGPVPDARGTRLAYGSSGVLRMNTGRRAPELSRDALSAERKARDAASMPSRAKLANLEKDCSYRLDELAAACNMSRRQMQRSFRALLACTPREFLREERLRAAHRLLGSATSVKEVAYALGFQQESQFSRDFKARFGVSPSDLQALVQRADVRVRRCLDGLGEACRSGSFDASEAWQCER
jgi:AraC-like DNA-binding protein